MIQDYKIKKINGEEILYIYLNYNVEFAKNKNKKTKLKKEINRYIKKHNIDFKGTTVAIIVGGIMMGTILLNVPKKSIQEYSSVNNHTISLINKEKIDINIEHNIDNNETQYKEPTKSENNIEQDLSDIKPTINNEKTNIELPLKSESLIEEESPDTIPNKEILDDKIYVTIYRQNKDILKLELEYYLIGVVAAEMPASFNIEALKAQAILARTYTMKAIETEKKLTDTSSTQEYKSEDELKSLWGSDFNKYYNKIKTAVDSTKGLIVTYNNTIIEAVYHSTSNGYTEDSQNVWKYAFPYLTSVESPYDKTNKTFEVLKFMKYEEISKKLNADINEQTEFIITLNRSGRVDKIEFNDLILTGVEFRTKLNLRSTDFTLEKTTEGINIITKGYGHGVGMSQYGANGMANNGSNYESILKHYYRGVTITQI